MSIFFHFSLTFHLCVWFFVLLFETKKVIRPPYLTERLKIKMSGTTIYLVYLNEWDLVSSAFSLQCNEKAGVKKNWFFFLYLNNFVFVFYYYYSVALIHLHFTFQSIKCAMDNAWIRRVGSTLLQKQKKPMHWWNKTHHLTVILDTVRKVWSSENHHWTVQLAVEYPVWTIVTGIVNICIH